MIILSVLRGTSISGIIEISHFYEGIMLRTLVIVRHAMPENISASGLDHDRKLTDLGINQAKQAASFIAELNLKNIKLLTSDASRALETAQTIGGAINSDLFY